MSQNFKYLTNTFAVIPETHPLPHSTEGSVEVEKENLFICTDCGKKSSNVIARLNECATVKQLSGSLTNIKTQPVIESFRYNQ